MQGSNVGSAQQDKVPEMGPTSLKLSLRMRSHGEGSGELWGPCFPLEVDALKHIWALRNVLDDKNGSSCGGHNSDSLLRCQFMYEAQEKQNTCLHRHVSPLGGLRLHTSQAS